MLKKNLIEDRSTSYLYLIDSFMTVLKKLSELNQDSKQSVKYYAVI